VNLETQAILLLALFSPFVELFPNLYMSWWAPSNGKLKRYTETWPRRIAIVFTVWIPILFTLEKIIVEPPPLILIIATLIFSAFFLRLYTFDKSIRQKTTPSKIPEALYFIAFSSIGAILYTAIPDKLWLVPTGILTIFLGASMMSTFRRKNLTLDIIGRLIFSTGFLINLYNLARATTM
jgi:hypothetical protein